MANSQRGEIDLVIDGKSYTLALDLNAMCELEDLLSTPDRPVSFQDVIRGLMGSRMNYVRAFFWATLRRHHKEITLAGVSDLMTAAGGLAPFLDKVGVLMELTQPDGGDGALKDSNGRPTSAVQVVGGTGRRSTGKRAKSA